jgi:hypothetical protein
MPDERVGGRVVVLFIALSVHFGTGVVGEVAVLWRTAEPHPLAAWVRPAQIAWIAILGILLVLTAWPDPRQRRAAQLVLPCAGLAAWLVVVGLVGPYPVTLRAELRAGAMTTAVTDLTPGPQSLAIKNATGTRQAVGLIRSDRPLGDADLADGFSPHWHAGVAWSGGVGWIEIEPLTCGFTGYCNFPELVLAPGEEARHALDLGPGYYALACARMTGDRYGESGDLVVDGRCRPVRFTVGMSPFVPAPVRSVDPCRLPLDGDLSP